ncbi:MAG TPA: alkaline phosphatase D family protein [Kofleriaceae bacterium]|jgi:alkaline phosphatase D|nr:alkaline phosphatase D family protein [Kofleriaceae bacterium]
MKRREFLERTGWFVVGATLVGIPGCGDGSKPSPPPGPDAGGSDPKGTFSFPQGVASGDPRDTSVVLWTRALRGTQTVDVQLVVQIASDAGFTTIVADRTVTATAATDHTVRVLVTNLGPGTTYYYRFTAGQDTISGRTITAPAAQTDVQVNFAWVSCQDYAAGNYGAYRQMILDDDARDPADRISAVIHLGDMIYETRASNFQTAIDDMFNPIALTNADGSPRGVPAFPSGGGTRAGQSFANTVDDYRSLYKTFLSDPDLQAARARWPFISIWDDHEFTDDCWQSQANYTDGMTLDEPDQLRRLAGSQAWFEYVPVHLTGIDGVVQSQAKDFAPPATPVTDAAFTAPNADNFVDEPNNKAAVGAITIYRSLRFGKHVELVMTDERSYRSDHAIPEELATSAMFLTPRNALPKDLVNLLDLGAASGVTQIPLGNVTIPNPRAASPIGTMLGKTQKQWWKDTMKGSDATWKLWGNEVTLMRLKITSLGATSPLPADLVVSADAWDGYNAERNELMAFLRTNNIQNVVVLTGDIHAAFAGQVMDTFDPGAPGNPATATPVAVEFVGPGVTSNSLFSAFFVATASNLQLNALIAADARPGGGSKFTENFNLLLLEGTAAAAAYAGAGGTVAPTLHDPPQGNAHLKYVDTNSQGYCYIKVGADKVQASIITIQRPIQQLTGTTGPGTKRTASFTVASGTPALGAGDPTFGAQDTKPFPLT